MEPSIIGQTPTVSTSSITDADRATRYGTTRAKHESLLKVSVRPILAACREVTKEHIVNSERAMTVIGGLILSSSAKPLK